MHPNHREDVAIPFPGPPIDSIPPDSSGIYYSCLVRALSTKILERGKNSSLPTGGDDAKGERMCAALSQAIDLPGYGRSAAEQLALGNIKRNALIKLEKDSQILDALRMDDNVLLSTLRREITPKLGRERIQKLRGELARSVLDLLHGLLRSGDIASHRSLRHHLCAFEDDGEYKIILHRAAVRLARDSEMIPSSIIIEGVMLDLIARAKGPVDGGLFSDIFRGTWNGTDVAIKRLRAYATDETGRRDIRRLAGVLAGLSYLHNVNVVHGDLHYGNILIDHDNHARIGIKSPGIGPQTPEYTHFTEFEQTGHGKIPTREVDVFAFGTLCWVMEYGQPQEWSTSTRFTSDAGVSFLPRGKMLAVESVCPPEAEGL
ncbi:hypothetical protein NLI96_g3651 [Meripilus lineatus]|uniref:Serine-threonine/tyrosine-protein kinase catalytic domain-containing protein n=1 Tax=Meripilus lineatus TaxID=2056292 RepID=A0AAD5V6H3_9APHY|nr:hypothetical protein NLI96_g3651 [Physisporinus lineatus]